MMTCILQKNIICFNKTVACNYFLSVPRLRFINVLKLEFMIWCSLLSPMKTICHLPRCAGKLLKQLQCISTGVWDFFFVFRKLLVFSRHVHEGLLRSAGTHKLLSSVFPGGSSILLPLCNCTAVCCTIGNAPSHNSALENTRQAKLDQ